MFTNAIKTILAAGIIASGASFATTSAANAASVGIHIGHGGFGIHVGHRRHGGHYYGHGHRRNVCKPRRALNKAWRMGVNRPHIKRIGPRRIVVTGFNYGHRAKVVFSRYGHRCPVIKTRGIYRAY